jgi:hypothetical protein
MSSTEYVTGYSEALLRGDQVQTIDNLATSSYYYSPRLPCHVGVVVLWEVEPMRLCRQG